MSTILQVHIKKLWWTTESWRDFWAYTVKNISIFPSPAWMSHTKLSLGGNNDVIYKLFPPRESLASDIPDGDGNIKKFFLQCSFFHGLKMRWEKAAALIPWFTFESGFSKKSRLPLKWGWAGDKNIFSAGYIDLGHVFRGKRNIILFTKEINTVMTHETVQQEKKVEAFPTLKK